MIYFIFIFLAIGIATFKIADKLQWEEYIRKRKKENKERWEAKQKGKPHGKRVRKRNKPPKRKR